MAPEVGFGAVFPCILTQLGSLDPSNQANSAPNSAPTLSLPFAGNFAGSENARTRGSSPVGSEVFVIQKRA